MTPKIRLPHVLQHIPFFLIILLFAALGWGLSPSWFSALLKSLSILGAGWLILSLMYRQIKKNVILILAFLSLFCYSIWVYQDVDIPVGNVPSCQRSTWVSLLAPINNTLSIFFPSRGAYETMGEQRFAPSQIHFQLVHLFSYLFFAMLAFSLFGRKIINRSRYYVSPHMRKYFFWDYSTESIMLARDIMAKSPFVQCIFVLSSRNGEDIEDKFEAIDRIGGIVLFKDFERLSNIRFDCRHFLFSDNQERNVMIGIKMLSLIKERNLTKAGVKKRCHIYMKAEKSLSNAITESYKASPKVDIDIISQGDLTARYFIKAHHMLNCPGIEINDGKVSGKFNMLVLGFGEIGRAVLHQCICDSQFAGTSFAATIFENDKSHMGSYKLFYKDCIEEYHLQFIDEEGMATVGTPEFYEWCNQNLTQFNRIIVALGNDEFNAMVALSLSRLLVHKSFDDGKRYIFAHVKESAIHLLPAEGFSYSTFGLLKEIYTKEVVVDEKMDRVAKVVNFIYEKENCDKFFEDFSPYVREIEESWDKCSDMINRDSSRAVASNIDNFYAIMDKREATFDKAVALNREKIKELEVHHFNFPLDEPLESLAQDEHLRWNAFELISGIGKWPVDEMPARNENKAKLYSSNNTVLLKHACIVPYEKLDAVSKAVNDMHLKDKNGKEIVVNYKENDRRIVMHIPSFKKFEQEKEPSSLKIHP